MYSRPGQYFAVRMHGRNAGGIYRVLACNTGLKKGIRNGTIAMLDQKPEKFFINKSASYIKRYRTQLESNAWETYYDWQCREWEAAIEQERRAELEKYMASG